jgi:hypothetical protein
MCGVMGNGQQAIVDGKRVLRFYDVLNIVRGAIA